MNTPSFACSLTDEGLRAAVQEWRALDRHALLRTEDRANGQLRVYRAGEETERVLAALIDAERRCCPFLDFTIDRREDEVSVSVSFPEEARRGPVVELIETMSRSPSPPRLDQE